MPQQQQQARQPQQAAARRKFNLDDFRIHRTLGTGSFGRVHLVQSRFNSRFYAMKVLKKTEVVRLKQVEHTNNEKMILERVEHPFLINLWGTFQDTRNLYMVMDYVVGGELFSVLRKSQVIIIFRFCSSVYALTLDADSIGYGNVMGTWSFFSSSPTCHPPTPLHSTHICTNTHTHAHTGVLPIPSILTSVLLKQPSIHLPPKKMSIVTPLTEEKYCMCFRPLTCSNILWTLDI